MEDAALEILEEIIIRLCYLLAGFLLGWFVR
jgi:hypothetical protein